MHCANIKLGLRMSHSVFGSSCCNESTRQAGTGKTGAEYRCAHARAMRDTVGSTGDETTDRVII
jgi:hypothetical protein